MKKIPILLLLVSTLFIFQSVLFSQTETDDPEKLLREGNRLFNRGKYGEAALAYEEAYLAFQEISEG